MVHLAEQNQQHQRRVRRLRVMFPMVSLVAILGLIAWNQIEKFDALRRVLAFVQAELNSIENGFIRTVLIQEDGSRNQRSFEFEKMEGTGLSGSPFDLGKIEFITQNTSGSKYFMNANAGVLNPQAGLISTPEGVEIAGPGGFTVNTQEATISMGNFILQSRGRALVYDQSGMILTAEQGLRFEPQSSSVILYGPSSAAFSSAAAGIDTQ